MIIEPGSVAVIGAVSWNHVIDVPHLPRGRTETLFATGSRHGVAATGAGKALTLARLGFSVRLHAQVGADVEGAAIRRELADAGIEFDAVVDPEGTEQHVNLMDPDGRRVSVYVRAASADPPVTRADLAAVTADRDHVWVNIANYARRALPDLLGAGRDIWVDVHDWDGRADYHREFVDAATHLFLSDENAPDPHALARELAHRRPLVVVTHGARGATAYVEGGRRIDVPPVPVVAVDPNGAGDAFGAGVMFGRTQGWDWELSLRAGAVVAAGCVAVPAISDPDLTAEWLLAQLGA